MIGSLPLKMAWRDARASAGGMLVRRVRAPGRMSVSYTAENTGNVQLAVRDRVGEIATVRIDRADAYDLHGTAVGF